MRFALTANFAARRATDRSRAKALSAGIECQTEPALVTHLHQRRTIFSNVGLVQCIKEIIEFAEEVSNDELSALDLTRCVLGVNQENDKSVDPGLMERAANPTVTMWRR